MDNLPPPAETGIRLGEGDRPEGDAVPLGDVFLALAEPSSVVNQPAAPPETPRSKARRYLRGPFTRWPRTADALLASVVFVTTAFVTSEGTDAEFAIRPVSDIPLLELVFLAVACGTLYWRRSHALGVLGVTLVATALAMGLGYSDLVGIAMMVALYSVGRYATNELWSYVALGSVWALVATSSFIEAVTAAQIGFGLFVMFLLWYVGRRIRNRDERAVQLERDQSAEARRAIVEERTRIARELHDVVAHRVSLMTVQAGAAKTIAASDPERAIQAMQAVEMAGRQALDELRHLLGVLRPEAEGEGLSPQPGLADVPRLVGQFGEAGLDISLTMEGERTELPARVDLSTYRIVQEALTNVLKHAGRNAKTEVRLSTDQHGVAIEVIDIGHAATILPGSGHGIHGMRERALLLGGSLEAGPRPGGGFQVVAHLPIGEESA